MSNCALAFLDFAQIIKNSRQKPFSSKLVTGSLALLVISAPTKQRKKLSDANFTQ